MVVGADFTKVIRLPEAAVWISLASSYLVALISDERLSSTRTHRNGEVIRCR